MSGLPARACSTLARSAAGGIGAAIMPGALKVLIVEDEPSVAHALGLLLDLHGIPTLTAGTPDEALRLLEASDVGLVIQDMNFDGTDTSGQQGIRLFRRIRQADPELPILLMTAWASLETAVQLVKEGADDYFAKPWDDEKLVIAIQNLLRMRRLQIENAALLGERSRARRELAEKANLCGMVYESDEMHRLVSLAVNVAGSDASVLLTGPSGSGKETLAEIIHANSRRRDKTLLRLNVGALPQELMEGELFGAEPGAYTGATALRLGHFEAADGGTVFLDEIGELPAAAQAALLRVLETKRFARVGTTKEIGVDVRVVAATHRDLETMVDAGEFRKDLLFRLNVITLHIPPLRERGDDILVLAQQFLEQANVANDGSVGSIDLAAMELLLAYSWPGNVRELKNAIERGVVISAGDTLTLDDLPERVRAVAHASPQSPQRAGRGSEPPPEQMTPMAQVLGSISGDFRTRMERLEAELLMHALRDADWNQTEAARQLSMPLRTLVYKIRMHGIRRPDRPRR